MSPSLHQTPVGPGFQLHDHTPHLARAEGISSERGEEKKRKKGQEDVERERKKGRGEDASHCDRGGDLGFVGCVVPDPVTSAGDCRACHCASLSPGIIVIEGQCNLTAMLLNGSIIYQRARSTKCR